MLISYKVLIMNENIPRKCYTFCINDYNWFKAHSAKYFISDTEIPKCLSNHTGIKLP